VGTRPSLFNFTQPLPEFESTTMQPIPFVPFEDVDTAVVDEQAVQVMLGLDGEDLEEDAVVDERVFDAFWRRSTAFLRSAQVAMADMRAAQYVFPSPNGERHPSLEPACLR
jgi:hypothetical protein